MNADLIGLLYIASTLLLWGLFIGLIYTIFKYFKRKNEYRNQMLLKLDEIIHLLKEKESPDKKE